MIGYISELDKKMIKFEKLKKERGVIIKVF